MKEDCCIHRKEAHSKLNGNCFYCDCEGEI